MDIYEIPLNDLIGKLCAWRNSHPEIKDPDKVMVQITGMDSLQIFPNQTFNYINNSLDTAICFPKRS